MDEQTKTCSKKENCVHPEGPELPATSEYFWHDNHVKSGLKASCIACRSAMCHNWGEKNPEKLREYARQWVAKNPEKNRERNKRYREKNPGCDQRYYAENAEKCRAYSRHYKRDNREKVNCYRRDNRDKGREYDRHRRSRKNSLPCNFTPKDEKYALDYFNGRCAICERPLADPLDEHVAAMDHWIPLSSRRLDNPGTVPTNMIPLCHGVGGCNNKKHNTDPAEWLKREFGENKASIILERIESYFESLKGTE